MADRIVISEHPVISDLRCGDATSPARIAARGTTRRESSDFSLRTSPSTAPGWSGADASLDGSPVPRGAVSAFERAPFERAQVAASVSIDKESRNGNGSLEVPHGD